MAASPFSATGCAGGGGGAFLAVERSSGGGLNPENTCTSTVSWINSGCKLGDEETPSWKTRVYFRAMLQVRKLGGTVSGNAIPAFLGVEEDCCRKSAGFMESSG